MSGAPEMSVRVARRAAGRIAAARALRTLGRVLVLGAGAGVVAAAAVSLFWGSVAGLLAAGACLVAAAVLAVVIEIARVRPLLGAAVRVDDALGLKDRLSSAIEFGRGDGGDAFVALAVADAERHAAGADVRRALPVRADRSWALWPMIGAAAVGAALVMPMLPRPGERTVDPERVARTRESISATAAELEEESLTLAEPEEAQQDAIDRMREIERELAEGLRTPEDAATEAAAVVEDAAERLEAEAQAERGRGLQEQLERIEPEEVGAAAALAEALRRGDMEAARRSLGEMAERMEGASEAEQGRIADDLRRLAEQIRSRPEPAAEESAGAAEPDAEAEDAGAEAESGGDTLPNESPPAEPEAVELEPEEEPGARAADAPQEEPAADMPEEAPRADEPGEPPADLSGTEDRSSAPDQAAREQAERGAQEEEAREQGRRDAEDLADRLDEMADEVQRPEESPSGGQERQGEPQPGREQPAGDPNRTEPGDATGGEQSPPDAQEPGERGSEQGETGEEAAEGERGSAEDAPEGSQEQPASPDEDSEGARPGESRQDAPAGERPEGGDTERGRSSDSAADEGTEPGEGVREGEGESGRSEDRPGGEGEPESSGLAADDPSNADTEAGATGDQPREGGASDGREGGSELDRAMDQLEKMDRQQRESLRKMAQSERLRQRAQELLEDASPEQRERLADLADRLMNDAPGGTALEDWDPETEVFDARAPGEGEEGDERRIGSTEPTGPPVAGGGERAIDRATRVREAAAAAEQAIEGQAIPRRYRDYVRQVYRRFEERAAGGAAPEGHDADTPGGGAGGD